MHMHRHKHTKTKQTHTAIIDLPSRKWRFSRQYSNQTTVCYRPSSNPPSHTEIARQNKPLWHIYISMSICAGACVCFCACHKWVYVSVCTVIAGVCVCVCVCVCLRQYDEWMSWMSWRYIRWMRVDGRAKMTNPHLKGEEGHRHFLIWCWCLI